MVAIRATLAPSYVSSSHSGSYCFSSFPQRFLENFSFRSAYFSSNSIHKPEKSGLVRSIANPSRKAVQMDSSLSNQKQPAQGTRGGTQPDRILPEALEQNGQKTPLIGQVVSEASVAEFKGPTIFGVVRLAQVNMELARIEATFSGLQPGKHGWTINEFGDLTKGAASTGNVFNPGNCDKEPLGFLGTLEVDEKGEAFFSGVKEKMSVADLIGRSIVVYETEDNSDRGLIAAVIARSAGVGQTCRKLCSCDGTTIWEATNANCSL